MKKTVLLLIAPLILPAILFAQEPEGEEPVGEEPKLVEPEKEDPKNILCVMKTTKGDIILELFASEAPKTVKNFLDLAEGKKEFTDPKTREKVTRPFFDGLAFHRIIDNFMIQGGCPLGSGMGGPGYSFEDEINADALGLDKEKAIQEGRAHKSLLIRSQRDFGRIIIGPLCRKLGIKNQEEMKTRQEEIMKLMNELTLKDVYMNMGYKYNSDLKSHFLKKGILAMANSGPNTNGSQFFINLVDTPWLNGKHTAFGKVFKGFDVVRKIGKTPVGAGSKPTEAVKVISIRRLEEKKEEDGPMEEGPGEGK
ncbi:MAG: peptidylprolyl isomerase [Planctomycetota bacterium]|jgi:peptidyl-prolyl cis-trans isomerase A (cyclophilin A)